MSAYSLSQMNNVQVILFVWQEYKSGIQNIKENH